MSINVTLNDFLSNIKKAFESIAEKSKEKKISEGKGQLDKQLADIDKAYEESPYRTYGGKTVVNLQEIDYTPPSDDEIYAIAESKIKGQKAIAEEQLKNTAEEKVKEYEKSKEKALYDADVSVAKLNADAEKAKKYAENQALKRGIGRSSIVMEELGEIDRSVLSGSSEIYTTAQRRIAEIDDAINSLRGKLSDALDKLDMDGAVKINDEVKKLQAERESKIAETAKYNNTVREKTANALNQLSQNGIETEEEKSDEYAKKNSEKIKKLYEYYFSLGDSAYETLEKDKDFIVSHVGEAGYSYLGNLLSK